MSDPKTLDADPFRFSIELRFAAPFHDGATDHIVDAVDGRVVAVFDAHDRAVAVQEILEAAHDVGAAAQHALGKPTDPVPLTSLGDVLRESVAGVLADRDAAHRMVDEAAESASVWRHQSDVEANRAAAAEQMVCELRAAAEAVQMAHIDLARAHNTPLGRLDDALSRTEDVAGRWVSVAAVIDMLTKSGLALGVHSASDLDTHIKRVREDVDAIIAERDAAIAARDEAVASLDVYEQRIREIADDVFGVQDAHAASVVLLDGIGRQCHRERIERIAAERARDEAVKLTIPDLKIERDAAIARAEKAEHDNAILQGVIQSDATQIKTAHAERDEAIRQRDEAVEKLVAERRCSAEEFDEARAERDSAIAALTATERSRDELGKRIEHMEATARHIIAVCRGNGGVEGLGNSDVEMAIKSMVLADVEQTHKLVASRDDLGIQLAAARAEIARMRRVVDEARTLMVTPACERLPAERAVCDALRALDAVPGDALAPVGPPSPAGASVPASGSTQGASSATSSSSEAGGNPSAHRGTCDASVRALIDAARAVDRCYDTGSSIRSSMYRLREALEASGIDTSNVNGVE